MENTYELQIFANNEFHPFINEILGIKATSTSINKWYYSVVDKKNDEYYDFINRFLDILEGKYDKLSKIGVNMEDITIWHIYVHDGQCNLEFDPQRMKRLGENGISLCVSCYQEE